MNPTPHAWQSIEELFAAAVDLPPDRRAEFLRESCPDEKLRREVESLLGFAASDDLLKKSPWPQGGQIGPNAVLGPYRVLERIGAGGMSEVYKARDTRLERQVALKVLPAYMVGDAERRARFIREARAASRLNDPNTVIIYDIGEQEGRIFIAWSLSTAVRSTQSFPRPGSPSRPR